MKIISHKCLLRSQVVEGMSNCTNRPHEPFVDATNIIMKLKVPYQDVMQPLAAIPLLLSRSNGLKTIRLLLLLYMNW